MNLAEFLHTRIAEDEALAHAALTAEGRQAWRVLHWANVDRVAMAYIDRHDPHRILADCEAKRGVVAWWAGAEADSENAPQPMSDQDSWRAQGLYEAMVLLASPYSGHPDFDPQWGR